MTVELQRPRYQYAVVGAEPSPRSEVVVVARARTLIGNAERKRAIVRGFSPVPKRRELPVRVATTELERNGVTSLLTDDKLALGTRYTHHKFTTLRHWGERADDGAFTLRVADRRAGSGDDDDHEPVTTYADDDGDDDGVLVSWTLQLYGHDSDTSTPWTPQPTPRGGCDSVAMSGSTHQTGMHGTYLPDGRCEDYVEYKCSDCSSTQYLWYHNSGYWAIGSGGCGTNSIGMYIFADASLADVTGDWSEYASSGW